MRSFAEGESSGDRYPRRRCIRVERVKVTAFPVEWPREARVGYRVDFRGHSVAISGDTALREFGRPALASTTDSRRRSSSDPALAGPPDELLPNSRQTRRQVNLIRNTTPTALRLGECLSG
jgi:hypothetical protein